MDIEKEFQDLDDILREVDEVVSTAQPITHTKGNAPSD